MKYFKNQNLNFFFNSLNASTLNVKLDANRLFLISN